MRHRQPSITRVVLVLACLSALPGGCAELHRGVEAVGRVGPTSAPAGEAVAAPIRPDIKTVRARGAPRAPAPAVVPVQTGAVEPPTVLAAAVPSPRQIFDFHPAGARPDSWRQPFVIDASDGPLAADVRRSAAELKAFLADKTAGAAHTAGRRCGETDVATGRPGCGAARPRAAVAAAPDGTAVR